MDLLLPASDRTMNEHLFHLRIRSFHKEAFSIVTEKNSHGISILLLLTTRFRRSLYRFISHLHTPSTWIFPRALITVVSAVQKHLSQNAGFRRHQASMGFTSPTLHFNGFHSVYALHLCVSLHFPLLSHCPYRT